MYNGLHDSYYSKFQIRLFAKINGHEWQLQPLHEYKVGIAFAFQSRYAAYWAHVYSFSGC